MEPAALPPPPPAAEGSESSPPHPRPLAAAREDTLEGFRAGADDYMVKPVDPEVLESRLRVAERTVGALRQKKEQALRQVVETRQSVVGYEHPALLESLRQLSQVYVEQNAFAKARSR